MDCDTDREPTGNLSRLMTRATELPSVLETLLMLHDAAFGRTGRESRLVAALALGHPAFRADLHVDLRDESTGEPIAAALVLPRQMELRGSRIPVGVLAPWCVSPTHRGQGNGTRVIDLAADRARELGLLALVTIGDPDYLNPLGFGSAFDLHTIQATTERLPEESAASEWRGLIGDDLPQLSALYASAKSGVSGAEYRDACVPDWEAHAAESYALVHAPAGKVIAYVRFRVREELEINECAASGAPGVEACLRLFSRLAREHGRSSLLVHAAPTQPVAFALASRGCVQERSRFDGASQLRVLDWPALFEATSSWWRPIVGERVLGVMIDGRCMQLDASPVRFVEEPPTATLRLPDGWAQGLFTGQRCARECMIENGTDSALDSAHQALVEAIFTSAPACWQYAPVYELADE